MSDTERLSGKCSKCGGSARYISGITYGRWIHTDTGQVISLLPTPHDVNTYLEIPQQREGGAA